MKTNVHVEVQDMKWQEVRELYSNQFVKFKVFESRVNC